MAAGAETAWAPLGLSTEWEWFQDHSPKGSSSLLEDFFQSDTRVSRGFRGLLVWDRVRVIAPWEVIGSSPRLLPVSVVFSVARNSPDHQEDRGQKLSSLKRKWRHASLKTG